MLATMTTVDGFPIPVDVAGPAGSPVVVVLSAAQRTTAAYDAVCRRLHTAHLRTVAIGSDPRLTAKSVVGIMDSLGIQWGVVVGDRLGGGGLAWDLAATRLDRFTALIAVDWGHPRVPDIHGVVADEHCPPVEINTTVLASTRVTKQVAQASQRYVYGDFRLVEVAGRRNAGESTAQLAAEIVLRASTW